MNANKQSFTKQVNDEEKQDFQNRWLYAAKNTFNRDNDQDDKALVQEDDVNDEDDANRERV